MRRQMDKGLEFFYDGKYKEAIAIFDKLILEDSTQYDVYFFRGSSWFNLKEVNKALADFNKAISLNPRFANAYSTRGDIYSYLGKKEEACKDYTLANNLGKPNMRDKLRFCP